MKDSLEHILHETLVNLVKVSVFYIPESFVNLLKVTKSETVMEEVNKLFLLDQKGFSLSTETTNAGLFIMSKKRCLNENIFLLFDFKEKHSKGGFDYVVEKYSELIESFVYISEWMNSHAQHDIIDITDSQKTALNLQYHFYLEHKQEFEAKFNKETRSLVLNDRSTKTVLKTFKPIVPKFSKLFVEKKTNKSLDRKQRIEKLKNNTREKAEEYLLQTVFKMKL
jgi:uncharacterized protein YcfL